jgi:predicted double-glycine peptidase
VTKPAQVRIYPRWVLQENAYGCGPACLAMILGISYADACREVEESPAHIGRDWDEHGTNIHAMEHALARHGYWWRITYKAWEPEGNWPPEPWAVLHLCQVEQPSGNAHFVVMLRNGVVLDPLEDIGVVGPHGLATYPDVSNVMGLTR